MAYSEHYDRLVDNLKIARKTTGGVDPLYCRTDLQDLKVQSYILLSHAAIEEDLESIVLETAQIALQNYVSKQIITRALIGLISSGLIARMEEKTLTKKVSEDLFHNIGLFSGIAFGRFKSLVGENNGIKLKDQRKLLLPIGIDPEFEDSVTTAALESFGGKRGAIAHGLKITKKHTLSEIDGDIATIVAGLKNFDQACSTVIQ